MVFSTLNRSKWQLETGPRFPAFEGPESRLHTRLRKTCGLFCRHCRGLARRYLRERTDRSHQGLGGGEKGIRTLETVTRLHTFQACAFDHSAISPLAGG